MVLPMPTIYKLQIRNTQKLWLVLVFSVCLITIALEIFRLIQNLRGDETLNNVLFAVLNASLTVIISCTPTYRSLWTLYRKRQLENSEAYKRSASSTRSRRDEPKAFSVDPDWSKAAHGDEPAMPLHNFDQRRSNCDLRPLQPAVWAPSSRNTT
jgi:hypothetical protein